MKLQGIKVELATADDIKNLTGKLDTMFKDGLGVYDYAVKKLKADGVSYDENKVGEADVQKLTDTYIAKVDAHAEAKEKDIMTV